MLIIVVLSEIEVWVTEANLISTLPLLEKGTVILQTKLSVCVCVYPENEFLCWW